jgi:DNA-binding CsgD family transcriptional regulator
MVVSPPPSCPQTSQRETPAGNNASSQRYLPHYLGISGKQSAQSACTAATCGAPSRAPLSPARGRLRTRKSALTSLILASHSVTGAQARVVALVLRGYSTKQIAGQLAISQYTIQEHLRAVFDKLGVRSRQELAAALMRPSR